MNFMEKFKADISDLTSRGAGTRKAPIVKILEPRVVELQALGFTMEQIATAMTEAGLPISRTHLSTALNRIRAERKKRDQTHGKTTLAVPPIPSAVPGNTESPPPPGGITKHSLTADEIKF